MANAQVLATDNRGQIFPLQPIFGRDYKTSAQVKKDWESGKDFRTPMRGNISIRNFKNFTGKVPIRFYEACKLEYFSIPLKPKNTASKPRQRLKRAVRAFRDGKLPPIEFWDACSVYMDSEIAFNFVAQMIDLHLREYSGKRDGAEVARD